MKKIKQFLAVLLCVILFCGVLPIDQTGWLVLPDFSIKTKAATTFTEGNYTYTVSNGEATITAVKSLALRGDIIIPETLGGYPVTTIFHSSFANCNMITSVTIPNTVTEIGQRAFLNCELLETIVIPSNEIKILAKAFEGTAYYNRASNWHQGVLYIGLHLIKAKDTISGSYQIINDILTIAEGAFLSCEFLESVIIPNSVIMIGESAFSHCYSLKSITIPSSVISIGDWAFHRCVSLDEISLPDSAISINYDSFEKSKYYDDESNWENGVLYIGKHLIEAENTISGSYQIKEGTLTIARNAFGNCSSLTSVTVPNSVVLINDDAFYSCGSLKSANIPDSVNVIGERAFQMCSSLESIIIPSNVLKINIFTFSGCSSLKLISILNGAKEIGDFAFSSCSALETITIPNSVTKLNKEVFFNCASLKSITIPNSITEIGEDIFSECSSLTDIWYTGTQEEFEKVFGLVEYNVHYNSCIGSANHTYSNDCDDICNICDNKRKIIHDYKNQKYDNKQHWNECECGQKVDIELHDFDWVIDSNNNCGVNGVKHEECSVCHMKKNENTQISATGKHIFENSCDTTCNLCKAERTIKHTYSNACDKTCNICEKIRTVPAHKYTNSCDTSCNACKAIRKIKHTYSNACDAACNVCNAKRTITHSYKTSTTKATFSENGSVVKKCTVCGNVASKTAIKYVKTIKLSATSYTYNGKVKTPSVIVKDSAGKTLKKNTDYTVTYAKGRKNVGTYKVVVKMKGKYSGTKTLTFKINPAKTSVKKLTAAKKSLKVAITKKSAQVTGYQVQYSTSKKFAKPKTTTVKSYKITSVTLKKLSAKKTYYVRVRTFKKIGAKVYYSGWSTPKAKKTK